ncbi:hypothetical protein QAD02_013218 [Eretmocerus hayati]|uniref:Uncharacterized protein n=1 Tax=Eretmocerus hayati TaxID=131215 RepID=A0ACC2P300_9HYME|nr:hypothetical protein QAD02_013218 [Eretmocerus hayati]
MGPSPDTLLYNWDTVRANLAVKSQERNLVAARNATALIERMDNSLLETLLLLLNHILPTMGNLNGWMQTNDVLPGVYFHIREAFGDILDCILHRDYLQSTPVEEIDPQDPGHHRNPLVMTIVPCLEQILLIKEAENEALEHIQRYLIRLATQVSQRLERY